MQSARLGKSNMQASRLALGTMNFGVRTPEADAFAIMDRALELGINLFDTANIYGQTTTNPDGQGITEEVMGRWFAQGGNRRESVILATKVAGSMHDATYGPNDARGYSGFKIRRQLDDSLRRLQTDHVELYQLHMADPGANWDDVYDAFDVASHQGKAFYLGCANHAARQLAYGVAAAERRHELGIVSEQHRYSLARRMGEVEVFPAVQEMDLGLIAFEPLAAGRLAGSAHAAPGSRREKALAKLTDTQRAQLSAYSDLCAELGESEAHVATAWVLSNPAVTTLLVGPRTIEQLEDSVQAAELVLSPDFLARLDEIFPPVSEG